MWGPLDVPKNVDLSITPTQSLRAGAAAHTNRIALMG
jgi:hypothetical protein